MNVASNALLFILIRLIHYSSKIWRQFFFNKLILLFSKGALNGSEVPVKTFLMLQKISILNKCCSFELSIHLWILKNKMHHGFHKNIVQHNSFQHW